MRVLVTGSSGHLGEALVRTLRAGADEVIGVDLKAGDHTDHAGSIVDRDFMRPLLRGVDQRVEAALRRGHAAWYRCIRYRSTASP